MSRMTNMIAMSVPAMTRITNAVASAVSELI